MLPQTIADESQLEELLSDPTPYVMESLQQTSGDFILLGVGGKMGPSLARMLVRALDELGEQRTVYAVSRFSEQGLQTRLEALGIQTLRGDLLHESFVGTLPAVDNVIAMTGVKFGTGGDASLTWGMNTWLPSLICRRFQGSRIAAFSTGNVYPLVHPDNGGCTESTPMAPVGEYGMSALGRERIYEFFSRRDGTPVSIIRLNYAVEMRYGVLIDLALQVAAKKPIDVSMGYANVIWQADANALALATISNATSPPRVVNVAGPELFSVRDVCQQIGQRLGVDVAFCGQESQTALLNDGRAAHQLYGPPRVSLETLLDWTADWVHRGGRLLSKPTHFQTRDGKF